MLEILLNIEKEISTNLMKYLGQAAFKHDSGKNIACYTYIRFFIGLWIFA